uniref:Uncharacterized protein n=1 Tax=Avena sativa TaxID=4498 RepID=A0ACD6A4E2_AVESA
MASDLDLSEGSSSPNLPPSSSAEGVKQGPAADISSWMMLDRFVFRRDDDDGSFPDEAAAPMRASSSTSLGGLFTVALLVAAPPAVSRLYVQWPRDPREPVDLEDKVTNLVTAHRNLLLLCTTSLLMVDKIPYRQDYFVFKTAAASASAGAVNSGGIKRLPACPEPLEGSNIAELRFFHHDTIGMVYRSGYSDDEFAVVQLAKFVVIPGCPNKMEAELCVFRSSLSSSKNEGVDVAEGKWEVLMLPIHHSEEEFSDLRGFSADGAITFNNSVCWVDYHHGGFLSYTPAPLAVAARGVGESIISYIRLPIDDRPNNSLPECLEMYRSLSVTGPRDNEQLKFIDVACKARAYVGPSFTITCHTFTPRSHHKWHNKVIITSEELWYINFRNPLMPKDSVITFPLVSGDEPHHVHFLMSEPRKKNEPRKKIGKVSVVVIDFISHKAFSASTCIQGDEDLYGKDADMVTYRSRLPPRPFIPSRF